MATPPVDPVTYGLYEHEELPHQEHPLLQTVPRFFRPSRMDWWQDMVGVFQYGFYRDPNKVGYTRFQYLETLSPTEKVAYVAGYATRFSPEFFFGVGLVGLAVKAGVGLMTEGYA